MTPKSTVKRIHLVWGATETVLTLDTGDICRIFGVPMGYHIVVHEIFGWEAGLSSSTNLNVWFDPSGIELDATFTEQGITVQGGGEAGLLTQQTGMAHSRKLAVLRADANDTYIPRDVLPAFHVYNDIMFNKAQGANWGFYLTYEIVLGAMIWLDEWADALSDKRNVAFNAANQAAGSRYYQVGNVYQIGKRTYD